MEKKNIFHYWGLIITKNYINFSGRARRKEFWSLILLFLLSVFALIFLSDLFSPWGTYIFSTGILFFVLPIISTAVRRLHDVGKSGFMLLIYFVPLIGGVWLLALLLTDSDYGTNKFGKNPKKYYPNDEIDLIGEE